MGFPTAMFTPIFAVSRNGRLDLAVEGTAGRSGDEDRPPAPALHPARRRATTSRSRIAEGLPRQPRGRPRPGGLFPGSSSFPKIRPPEALKPPPGRSNSCPAPRTGRRSWPARVIIDTDPGPTTPWRSCSLLASPEEVEGAGHAPPWPGKSTAGADAKGTPASSANWPDARDIRVFAGCRQGPLGAAAGHGGACARQDRPRPRPRVRARRCRCRTSRARVRDPTRCAQGACGQRDRFARWGRSPTSPTPFRSDARLGPRVAGVVLMGRSLFRGRQNHGGGRSSNDLRRPGSGGTSCLNPVARDRHGRLGDVTHKVLDHAPPGSGGAARHREPDIGHAGPPTGPISSNASTLQKYGSDGAPLHDPCVIAYPAAPRTCSRAARINVEIENRLAAQRRGNDRGPTGGASQTAPGTRCSSANVDAGGFYNPSHRRRLARAVRARAPQVTNREDGMAIQQRW